MTSSNGKSATRLSGEGGDSERPERPGSAGHDCRDAHRRGLAEPAAEQRVPHDAANSPLKFFNRVTGQMREWLRWCNATLEGGSTSGANPHATFEPLTTNAAALDAELQRLRPLYTQLRRAKPGSMRTRATISCRILAYSAIASKISADATPGRPSRTLRASRPIYSRSCSTSKVVLRHALLAPITSSKEDSIALPNNIDMHCGSRADTGSTIYTIMTLLPWHNQQTTSIYPKGYFISLDSIVSKSDADIGGIKWARMLFDSLVKLYSKDARERIAATRLEEQASRMVWSQRTSSSSRDKRVLRKVIPQSVKLWFSLAHLEPPDKATAVLNKAPKVISTSHEIWTAAGRPLEQEAPTTEKSTEQREKELALGDKAIESGGRDLRPHQVLLTREQWLKRRGAKGNMGAARVILAVPLRIQSLWWKAADLEKARGMRCSFTGSQSINASLERAVPHRPQAEVLWLMWAKEKWLAEDVPSARGILERAFIANPETEFIGLVAVKLRRRAASSTSPESFSCVRGPSGTLRGFGSSLPSLSGNRANYVVSNAPETPQSTRRFAHDTGTDPPPVGQPCLNAGGVRSGDKGVSEERRSLNPCQPA
ncbi:hypothetical protein C8T65DRAFT_694746 [Cerioporus squamosus]|nr:hypothetical protein C8T65DRAFT_694746 [Cerioporus squamosus]